VLILAGTRPAACVLVNNRHRLYITFDMQSSSAKDSTDHIGYHFSHEGPQKNPLQKPQFRLKMTTLRMQSLGHAFHRWPAWFGSACACHVISKSGYQQPIIVAHNIGLHTRKAWGNVSRALAVAMAIPLQKGTVRSPREARHSRGCCMHCNREAPYTLRRHVFLPFSLPTSIHSQLFPHVSHGQPTDFSTR
jgi:hypothetical protein